MKKIFLVLIIAAVIFSSCGDGHTKINAADVPAAVVTAFNTKYPGAADIRWVTENKKDKKIYEAIFKLNDKEVEAEFDESGNFIEED